MIVFAYKPERMETVFMRREMDIQQIRPVRMHGIMRTIVLSVKQGTELYISGWGEFEKAALCREVNA